MKKQEIDRHIHKWKENTEWADNGIIMLSGSPDDLGEEVQVICECGDYDYVRIKDLGSLTDLAKE